jgi:hypothetical protein
MVLDLVHVTQPKQPLDHAGDLLIPEPPTGVEADGAREPTGAEPFAEPRRGIRENRSSPEQLREDQAQQGRLSRTDADVITGQLGDHGLPLHGLPLHPGDPAEDQHRHGL